MALVLISATAFGTNAIFAKLAYREGLGTSQLLAFRFVLAAMGMWGLALVLRQNPLRFERRSLLALFGLGAIVSWSMSRVAINESAVASSATIASGVKVTAS